MSKVDELVGRNVAGLRGTMPQQELARQVRERSGHKWSQATVWSIEKGERPLRFSEAIALAEVLNCKLDDLMARDWSQRRLQEALFNLQFHLDRAADAVADVHSDAVPLVRQARLEAQDRVSSGELDEPAKAELRYWISLAGDRLQAVESQFPREVWHGVDQETS